MILRSFILVSALVSSLSFAAVHENTFRNALREVLEANKRATDLNEWTASQRRPENLFEDFQKLQNRDQKTSQEFCQALSELAMSDLALFEEELSSKPGQELPCSVTLLSQLNQYWGQAQTAFDINRLEEALERNYFSGNETAPLPNLEKHIDTVATPYLIRGDLKPGEIAFTFDDGPHASRTARILETLNEYGVRANFFQIGQNVKAMPQISKQVADAGHLVCNHTWSHPLNMTRLSMEASEKEFDRGREIITQATGTDIPFFRFPGGNKNAALLEMVKARQFASFYWTMDTRDWQIRDPEALYQNVLKELNREKGGIILFHDVHQQTVIVLPRLLEELRLRNFSTYVFVPH